MKSTNGRGLCLKRIALPMDRSGMPAAGSRLPTCAPSFTAFGFHQLRFGSFPHPHPGGEHSPQDRVDPDPYPPTWKARTVVCRS